MFSTKAMLGSLPLIYNTHSSSIILATIFMTGILLTALAANYVSAFNAGVVGDWGCNSATTSTVNRIKSFHSPERVFALGDYSYQSNADCWLDKISSIKSITRIAIGNHEDDSGEGFSQYMSAFGLSKTYYTMTFSNMRVIVMDTDRNSYSQGSSQYNFVVSELQKASQDSNIKWIVVYLHKQLYTSPNECGSSSCSNTGSDATNLRNIYHPKFDQYGVDLVLNGHLHNYQRTFPIKYDSGSPSSPIKACSNSNTYGDCQGQIYATVGTGGINIHALSGKSSFVVYQQDDRFGALDLNIENNGDTLAGRYYTNDGVQRDFFKITKAYTTAAYTFGPSLTLSGENTEPQSGQINENNGKQLGLETGQGKGLDCEHFTQQGNNEQVPERCR
jgi:Calcineurin-like phosphoesterase